MRCRCVLNRLINNKRLILISLVALFLVAFSNPVKAATNQTLDETPSGAGQGIAASSFVSVAIVVAGTVIAGAYCLVKGTTIGASAMTEKPETSSWGLILDVMGATIIAYGLVISLLILMPEMFSFLVLLAGCIPIVALALIGYTSWNIRTKVPNEKTFNYVTYATILSIIIVIISSISIGMSGGEIVIPETAWPLILGAVTMVGAGFCAAMCIVAAVNAGSKAMLEKPELSIWALLFVALGEGLAIYGLIVAILIIMR